MRMTRRVRPDFEEQDVFTWRHLLVIRRWEIRKAKRRANKRDRREAKDQIRKDRDGNN